MDYNKFGVNSQGQVDPLRGIVHNIVGPLASPYGGMGTRKMADDLYAWMKSQGSNDKSDPDKSKAPNLIYNPKTGAFEPVAPARKDEKKGDKEGVLSQAMAPAPSASMYAPIQAPPNPMMMANMNMPSAPNINPYNIQRYLDPRYRGGM